MLFQVDHSGSRNGISRFERDQYFTGSHIIPDDLALHPLRRRTRPDDNATVLAKGLLVSRQETFEAA